MLLCVMRLSKSVKEGLKHLGTYIPLDARKLIGNCIKLTLNPDATIPPVPESSSSEAKQAEYAIVALYSLAIKHCLDGMYLRQMLEKEIEDLNSRTIDELVKIYEDQKKNLILRHLQVGHSFPHVTDLQWRIMADVKSSSLDSSSRESAFYINMGRYKQNSGERETVCEFVCNTEELQLLINKLKEIERHCEKWSSHDL